MTEGYQPFANNSTTPPPRNPSGNEDDDLQSKQLNFINDLSEEFKDLIESLNLPFYELVRKALKEFEFRVNLEKEGYSIYATHPKNKLVALPLFNKSESVIEILETIDFSQEKKEITYAEILDILLYTKAVIVINPILWSKLISKKPKPYILFKFITPRKGLVTGQLGKFKQCSIYTDCYLPVHKQVLAKNELIINGEIYIFK